MKLISKLICSFSFLLVFGSTAGAQLGTGPESIMGFSPEQSAQASYQGAGSLLNMARFETPLAGRTRGDNLFGPSYRLDYTAESFENYYYLSLINRDEDVHASLGYSYRDLAFSTFFGDSSGTLSNRAQVSGISPNFFHGGVDYPYQYSGASVGFSPLAQLTVFGGAMFIDAEELEKRATHYYGFQYKKFYTTLTSVSRAGSRVGYSLVTGFDLDHINVAYQQYESEYQAVWRELSIGLSQGEMGSLRFNMGTGSSALYEDSQETRFAVIYSIPLGGTGSAVNSGDRERSGETVSTLARTAGTFHLLGRAGYGAVGSGLALSSGSAVLDSTPRFKEQDAAAYFVLAQYNPISVAENREYGSSIYVNRDGSYSASNRVVRGLDKSIAFNPFSLVPPGTRTSAIWHTHGAYDRRYLSEQFSPADIRAFRGYNLDGYLGTPLGRMSLYDVETGRVFYFTNDRGSDIVLPH